jgi:hypothetical protein
MSYQTNFKGIIWTNHALERLRQRRLHQDDAYKAFKNPDTSVKGKQSGTIEMQKRFGPHLVTIIAKQDEKRQWIILSCWVDPPMAGTIDARKKTEYIKYKKAGFWGKFWIGIRRQLFGW